VSDAFYLKLGSTAAKLLQKFGSKVIFKRIVRKPINQVTGQAFLGTTFELSTNGFVQRYADKLIDDTRIKDSDRLLIIDNSFQPILTDRPQIDGQQWNIVDIKAVQPAALPLVYFVQVRR
jgi:hypothetical protein